MAKLLAQGPMSGHPQSEYTAEFTSSSQPYLIYVRGDFASPDSWRSRGEVVVEFKMDDGAWVESTDMRFSSADSGTFRLAQGMMGRVKVTGCSAVYVEVHSSEVV